MRLDILFLFYFLFLIVGLIACSPSPNPTPTLPSTLFPSVTLTTYNSRFITTLTPDSLPPATIFPSASEFAAIHVSPPNCYPLDTQHISCLGYVDNQSENVVEDVTLQATFVDAEGHVQREELFTLEQRTINAGEVAPYRIQVPPVRLETNHLEIQLMSAQLSPDTQLDLHLSNMQGTYHLEENRYIFTAELENLTAFIATDTRLIITLENEDGNIIGFRVADISEELPSGDTILIRVQITPLEATTTIRHRITLEAFPSDSSPTPAG